MMPYIQETSSNIVPQTPDTVSHLQEDVTRGHPFTEYLSWLAMSNQLLNREESFEKIRQVALNPDAIGEAKNLFRGARGQRFENGMESPFSRDLVSLVKEHGDVAVKAIAEIVFSEEAHAEVIGEALHWLGDIDDPKSDSSRLDLLEKSLKSPSPSVRDGAALGIAFLDNPHAIPFLQDAIKQEKHPGLRQDLQQVLDQLEETLAADTQNDT